jgi:error-prone DNA polymerase
VLPPEVNASQAGCTVTAEGAVRIGLGYVLGVRGDDVAALVAAREAHGPFRSLEDLASRAGAGRATLEQLAWSGACDRLAAGGRRQALWELGVTAAGHRVAMGTQLALPLGAGDGPSLPALGAWDSMIADYSTTGLTTADHPMRLMREELRERGLVSSRDLERLAHGSRVRLGGLVVARQRPGTANGVCFLLLEDEEGTLNLIVPPRIYERDRLTVRTEPLVVAEGVLERHASAGGAINVLCQALAPLHRAGPAAVVKDFSPLDERELEERRREQESDLAATGTGDIRAVAPPVMTFGAGRRR